MTLHLRAMVEADIAQVMNVEKELFGAGSWSEHMLREELAAPGRTYTVAVADGSEDVLGYAGLWHDGHDASVMTMAVAPSVQRQGIGWLLSQHLIGEAKSLAAGSVFLEVRVDNEPAITMYEALGFARLRVRPRYYQPEDIDALTMGLELRKKEPAGFRAN